MFEFTRWARKTHSCTRDTFSPTVVTNFLGHQSTVMEHTAKANCSQQFEILSDEMQYMRGAYNGVHLLWYGRWTGVVDDLGDSISDSDLRR